MTEKSHYSIEGIIEKKLSLTDFHIPDKMPKIGVQTVESSDGGRVTLAGDPFHFGAFQPGDEFVVCDYDLPQENLTQITRGYTDGPVLFQGAICTEIVTHEQDAKGQPLQLVRRLVTRGPRFARILLVSLRRPDGMGSVEITSLEIPLVLEQRIRWVVVRTTANDPADETAGSVERIAGLVDVFIGKQSFRCIRWLRTRTTGMGYREAEEIFVDIERGLTVLIRGFVGGDYPQIGALQRSPQVEIIGEIFYLRYVRRVLRHSGDHPLLERIQMLARG
ncbi:MAG: hypothetical protein WBM02_05400 [bacterium]